MKLGLPTIARGIIILMSVALVSLCALLLPELAREEALSDLNPDRITYPFLLGAWVLSLPIFVALFNSMKLVGYIEKNTAFSHRSVKALQNIKLCTITFSIMIVLGAVTVIRVARGVDPMEDVTPVITFSFVLTFVSVIIATLVAVLQKVLSNAIDMKSENDLII